MTSMKPVLLFLACTGLLAPAAELAGVHKVYLMPMPHGMDQFLANRLTNQHLFEVVTDPKLADAVFTDHLGEGFEAKLEDLTAPPPKPEPKAKPNPDSEPKAKPAPTASSGAPGNPMAAMGDTVNKLSNPAMNSSFGRGQGTLFLVNAKSKQVVWSVYAPAKDSSAKEMDRTASAIVSRLSKDLNPTPKQK